MRGIFISFSVLYKTEKLTVQAFQEFWYPDIRSYISFFSNNLIKNRQASFRARKHGDKLIESKQIHFGENRRARLLDEHGP